MHFVNRIGYMANVNQDKQFTAYNVHLISALSAISDNVFRVVFLRVLKN